MKSIEQTVTKELSQNAEVKSLLKEETQVKDMTGQLSKLKMKRRKSFSSTTTATCRQSLCRQRKRIAVGDGRDFQIQTEIQQREKPWGTSQACA